MDDLTPEEMTVLVNVRNALLLRFGYAVVVVPAKNAGKPVTSFRTVMVGDYIAATGLVHCVARDHVNSLWEPGEDDEPDDPTPDSPA